MSERPKRPRLWHDQFGWVEQDPGEGWDGYIVSMLEYIAGKLEESGDE